MTFLSGMNHKRLSDSLTGVSLVLTCLFLLSGCLFNRVQTVKAQTCDFDRNFTFVAGTAPSLTFHEPILLKSDIERLLDFEPLELTRVDTGMIQRYRIAQLSSDGQSQVEYDVTMTFVSSGTEWRLASVHLPRVVSRFFEAQDVARAAQRACEAEWRWAGLGIVQALSPEDLELLPTRSDLITALGPPTAVGNRGGSLTWAFRPLPTAEQTQASAPATPLAQVTVHFDAEAQPERLWSSYRGLRAEADFQTLEARFSFRGGGGKK